MRIPVKQSSGLPDTAIEKIRAEFNRYPEIQRVILFGSRAIGTYQVGSDIDLCIEAESLNLTQLLKIENALDELLLPWKIDLSLKHFIDNPALLAHIRAYGIIFYP